MKSKFKIRNIEDIAIQYIKREEPIKSQTKKENIINTFKTLIDYKFCKKIILIIIYPKTKKIFN